MHYPILSIDFQIGMIVQIHVLENSVYLQERSI